MLRVFSIHSSTEYYTRHITYYTLTTPYTVLRCIQEGYLPEVSKLRARQDRQLRFV